jgi:hypothetical protein
MSPDPNDEYFADGMAEETIASVSRMMITAETPGVEECGRTLSDYIS